MPSWQSVAVPSGRAWPADVGFWQRCRTRCFRRTCCFLGVLGMLPQQSEQGAGWTGLLAAAAGASTSRSWGSSAARATRCSKPAPGWRRCTTGLSTPWVKTRLPEIRLTRSSTCACARRPQLAKRREQQAPAGGDAVWVLPWHAAANSSCLIQFPLRVPLCIGCWVHQGFTRNTVCGVPSDRHAHQDLNKGAIREPHMTNAAGLLGPDKQALQVVGLIGGVGGCCPEQCSSGHPILAPALPCAAPHCGQRWSCPAPARLRGTAAAPPPSGCR